MKIIIETIPHHEQRYDTVGDWQWKIEGGEVVLRIKVSKLGIHLPTAYELLVAVHELIEAICCDAVGIRTEEVDKFDLWWEENQKRNVTQYLEPGENPSAPYYHQHQFASGIERLLAAELRIDWTEYEQILSECGNLE